MWRYYGFVLAKISSFYTYIDLAEFGVTLYDLFRPIWSLLWSPYQFIKGYWETARSYATKTSLIWFGSATLIAMLAYCWFNYASITTSVTGLLQFNK